MSEEQLEVEVNDAMESEESSELEQPIEASSEDQLEEAIEEAIENGASNEEIKSMIKAFDLKVNGKTIRKEIDLSDEESLKRELQLAAAGRQSMQKVAELEKAYDQALQELRNNPAKFLSDLGMDFDDLSEKHLRSKLEELKKSPEQIERENMQRELEEARAEAKRLKEEREKAEYERSLKFEQDRFEKEVDEALSAHKDLPSGQKTFQKIAETMLWAIDNGFKDVTVEDVIPTVKAELEKEQQEFFNNMPIEFIEKFIGKQTSEKLRQQRLSQMKKASPLNSIKETASKGNEDDKPKKKIKASDFFKNL